MLDSKEIRRQNLRTLIEESGTAAGLAEKAQTSAAYISQILSPKTKAFVGDALARKLENAMQRPHGWMDTLHYEGGHARAQGPKQPLGEYGQETNLSTERVVDVPVIATIECRPDGSLEEPKSGAGEGSGFIQFLAKDPHTYALRMRGDSMRPRIKSGEFIVIEPNVKPHPGDDVVVQHSDGRRMVKELLYIRGDEITLGPVNNGFRPITLSLSEVETVHSVAAICARGLFFVDGG